MAIRAKKLQPAKVEAIANVKTVLEGYNDYIFADYRGLTVEQITELRKQLRAKDCQFKVMKNNFVKVAFDEMKIENLADYLAGPTAIALLKDDPNEVAKILFDFAKEAPALQVKGAFIDKEIYDAEKIEAFLEEMKAHKQALDSLRQKMSSNSALEIMNSYKEVKGIKIISATIPGSVQELRATSDAVKEKAKDEAVLLVLCGLEDDKIMFLASATDKALSMGVHCGKIIKEVTAVAGGSGGGKPDMAQGGGKDKNKVDNALAIVDEIVDAQIK